MNFKGITLEFRAFTLIELLVVVAIISLLGSIILSSLTASRSKARDATRLATLQEMGKAVEFLANGPTVNFIGCGSAGAAHFDASTCTGPAPISFTSYKDPYNSATPCAPGAVSACQYSVSLSGGGNGIPTSADFEICSYLESANGRLTQGLVAVTSTTSTALENYCK